MNLRFVANQLGLLLTVLAVALLLIGAWSALLALGFHVHEERAAAGAFAIAGVGGLGIGFALRRLTRGCPRDLERREALLLVSLSWILGAALSASPYLLWAHLAPASLDVPARHALGNPVNCYFETMSGLTTTGATVIVGIPDLPRSVLLWRATTHWLGGLGIVVLFVAVLPSLGVAGKRLFSFESAGPSPQGVRPEIRETARILWLIYVGITVAQVLALRVVGMGWFDSICHTFATVATGGFSTQDASIGAYHSAAVDWITIVFMVLAGANFGIYYQLIRRRYATVRADPELRLYLTVILLGGALVSILILGKPVTTTTGETFVAGPVAAARYAFFQTVSIQTTTGFGTADFHHWPDLARVVLVLLMFFGACAGSTAGGIKIIRLWIVLRVLLAEVEHMFRPNVIRPMKVGGTPVSPDLKLSAVTYVAGVMVLWVLGIGILLAIEPSPKCDIITAATASVATLCTIGPGLGEIGPVKNYAWFSDASKLVLALWMLLGRLEIFTIVVLFSPRFWRD